MLIIQLSGVPAIYNFAFCISGLCELTYLHRTTVYMCLVQYLYRLKHVLVSKDNLFIPAQNITGSVVEALLPVLKEMKADMKNLNELYSNLSETVTKLEETVSNLNTTVEEHKSQTTSELAALHTSIDNPPTNVIAIAVLGILLPYLNNLDEKIDKSTNSLTEDLSSLSGSITDLTEKVCNVSDSQIEIVHDMNETVSFHMEHLNSNMISVNYTVLSSEYAQLQQLDVIDLKLNEVSDILQEQHREIESQLEQHNNHVTSELIELEIDHNTTYSKLDSLDTKQDELNMKVMSVSSELEQNILSNVTEELKKTYDLLNANLCGYTCGDEEGWRRVVYLNMRDLNTNCPSGWQQTTHSKRTCGKVSTNHLSCDSVFFQVSGGDYNRVCGTIRAYQYGYIDAFEAYDEGQATTIDGAYVAGVSLTHGSPRQHIWTFAAGATEENPSINDACPCDATSININIPPFVGGDYFCESGRNSSYGPPFAEADPLWDGKGCTSTSTCCELNNPPYFTKQLTSPTTDDIEARLCRMDGSEDSPVEFIELYVKGPSDDECVSKIHSINSKIDEVAAILSNEHRDIRDDIDEHKNHVNSELIELETNQDDIDTKLDLLDTKQDELSMSFSSDLEQNILSNVTEELKKTRDSLDTSLGHTVCGGEGGWRRVVYLDMTHPNANCPSGWQQTTHSKRTCGKVSTNHLSCDSVFFQVSGGDYNRVCGTIRAYQYGYIDAFEAYDEGQATTIDGAYVAGVSLTHGSPRQHIWTFAAGATEENPSINDACPCDATSININIPPFVGGDYFCESGRNSSYGPPFAEADPLWDGKGCTSTSTCCELNNPPYFTKQLTNPTTDDIEARLCRWESGEDSPIEFIELYVKDDLYTCGGEGGWRQVVYLNMTNPYTNCPTGWQLTTHSKRTCGKVSTSGLSCDSVFFPVTGGDYNKVCGRIRAYQYGYIDAFEAYDEGQATTIDVAYVAGVSLTHGSPRQHIWTFAAGATEENPSINDACPCDATAITINIPPFVGGDYFCESGVNFGSNFDFRHDDPLWDGENCASTSTCCEINNPPYFTKQLTNPTTDDIEARLCRYDGSEDTPIEFMELYVK